MSRSTAPVGRSSVATMVSTRWNGTSWSVEEASRKAQTVRRARREVEFIGGPMYSPSQAPRLSPEKSRSAGEPQTPASRPKPSRLGAKAGTG